MNSWPLGRGNFSLSVLSLQKWSQCLHGGLAEIWGVHVREGNGKEQEGFVLLGAAEAVMEQNSPGHRRGDFASPSGFHFQLTFSVP